MYKKPQRLRPAVNAVEGILLLYIIHQGLQEGQAVDNYYNTLDTLLGWAYTKNSKPYSSIQGWGTILFSLPCLS